MNTQRTIRFVVALGAISLFGLGCNPLASLERKAGEKAAEGILSQASGGKVSVDADSGQYAFKDNKTGASFVVGENVSLPSDFPKDIPVYPDSKTLTASTDPSQGGASVTFQSSDDVAKATRWYEDRLKNDGWKQSSSFTAGGSEIRAYEKGTVKLSFTIQAANGEEKGGCIITIVRAEEKP